MKTAPIALKRPARTTTARINTQTKCLPRHSAPSRRADAVTTQGLASLTLASSRALISLYLRVKLAPTRLRLSAVCPHSSPTTLPALILRSLITTMMTSRLPLPVQLPLSPIDLLQTPPRKRKMSKRRSSAATRRAPDPPEASRLRDLTNQRGRVVRTGVTPLTQLKRARKRRRPSRKARKDPRLDAMTLLKAQSKSSRVARRATRPSLAARRDISSSL